MLGLAYASVESCVADWRSASREVAGVLVEVEAFLICREQMTLLYCQRKMRLN